MITEEFNFPSAEEGETIYGKAYLPYGEVRGIVQFAHGMCDYGERYEELFRELTDCGYIAAYADHLGHGNSVRSLDDLGYFSAHDGYKKVAEDFNTFYGILDERFPCDKHYVMGHSMGSFIVRYFMAVYRRPMAGAILMGTSGPNPLAGVGAVLAAGVALIRGGYYRSSLLEKMAFGSYNKQIKDPVSAWDWLSRDENAVYDFDTDELRNQTFTASGFKDLFSLVRIVNLNTFMDDTPKELPILLLSGKADPLGNYGKGIFKLEDIFHSMNFQDVKSILFSGARHELCHELNREEVFETIVDWLNRHAYDEVNLTYPEDEDPYDFDFEEEEEAESDRDDRDDRNHRDEWDDRDFYPNRNRQR